MTQPTTQPMTQPTTQPMTQPMTRPMTRPMTQPTTQPMNRPMTQPMTQPTTQPMNRSMTQPTNQIRQITMPGMSQDMQETIISYVVKDGDTLEGLLERFGIDVEDLLKFNTSNRIYLKPGSTLIIPEKSDEE